LEKAILKFVPGSKGLKTSTGKVINKHNETGIQIVVDRAGRYSRIENINLAGKRRYLDLTGHIPNNKVINRKITGRNQKEYNQVTHFNNTD